MNRVLTKGIVLAIIFTMLITTIVMGESTNSNTKITAYDFEIRTDVQGSKWWQSGTITFTNNSDSTLKNWVLEFESSRKLNGFDNYKSSVTYQNGKYLYKIQPQSWTNRQIAPGDKTVIKIRGSKIAGVHLTNCVLSDQNKQAKAVEEWALRGIYKKNDIVIYNNQAYKCRQSHTAYAPNWTPNNVLALWLPIELNTISSN